MRVTMMKISKWHVVTVSALTATVLITVVGCLLLSGCALNASDINSDTRSFDSVPVDRSYDGASDEFNVLQETQETESVEQVNTKTDGLSVNMQNAKEGVKALVSGYGDDVAVSVMSLDDGSSFDINGDKKFISASMIKLLILATLVDKVNQGSVSLDQGYTLKKADIVGGTGHINTYPLGTSFSYGDLAKYMIAYSDNTATNVLIDVLGKDSINSEASKLGLVNTSLNRKMMDLDSGVENYMSTNDAASILCGFANKAIGGAVMSETSVGYLKAQTDNNAISKGIPSGVSFAHKTGTLNSVRHDGGIVYADEPYVIVVFTTLGESAANSLMRDISSSVYKALCG